MPDQLARPRRAERCRGDDEIVDRHHPRRHLRHQPAEIAVARDDQEARPHPALRRADLGSGARLHRHGPARFKEAHPGRGRGAGEAERIVQRVQMLRPAVEHPAVIGARPQPRRDAGAVERLGLGVTVVTGELLGLGVEPGHLSRAAGGVDHAGLQVAGDPMARDEAAHQGLGLLGHVPECARPLHAEARLKPVLVAPLARTHLPAVPPRGPPADALRLEQHHVETGLRQMQRRREPGVAAADHADIGLLRPLKRRKGRELRRRRGIPARRVDPVVVVGGQQVKPRHQATGPRRSYRFANLESSRFPPTGGKQKKKTCAHLRAHCGRNCGPRRDAALRR